jgi:hypothetical protein
LVGAISVVVPGVAAKDPIKVSFTDYQEMVEAFGSKAADEPLGVSIRVWRSDRSLEDVGTS